MLNPQILNYLDYRLYLKDVYTFRKKTEGRYSYRKLSEELGFSSSNFIHLIVQGKRNLSQDGVRSISKALNLSALEYNYFTALLQLNHSDDEKEKRRVRQELDIIVRKQKKILSQAFDKYFGKWYYPVIREMAILKKFVSNLSWISRNLVPQINQKECREAMDTLEKLKMLRKEGGRWFQVEEHLATPYEVTSDQIIDYHHQMIQLADKALDEMSAEDRKMVSMTMSVSERQFQEVSDKIFRFLDEIQQDLVQQDEDSDLVAQLNIQLFPVTKR